MRRPESIAISLRRHSVFDHGCLLAQKLIKQLLQLVEGLGQTLSAQQLGDHGATGEEAYKDGFLRVVVLVTRKFRQGAFDDGALAYQSAPRHQADLDGLD